jgi:hypothetical protein
LPTSTCAQIGVFSRSFDPHRPSWFPIVQSPPFGWSLRRTAVMTDATIRFDAVPCGPIWMLTPGSHWT